MYNYNPKYQCPDPMNYIRYISEINIKFVYQAKSETINTSDHVQGSRTTLQQLYQHIQQVFIKKVGR